MIDLEQFSGLVDAIYEGATDAQAWPSILEKISVWLNVSKGLLFTPLIRLDAGGFANVLGLSQACIQEWAAPDAPADLWAQRILEQGLDGEGQVVLGQDVVPQSELVTNRWYTDFLSRHDLGQVMTGIVFGLNRNKMPVTSISFYRSLNEAAFTELDRKKLSLVIPHVSRALGVLMTLRDAEFKVAASREALHRMDVGVMLFDHMGHMCFINRTCQALFDRKDGISSSTCHDNAAVDKAQLSIVDARSRAAVDVAIQAALARDADVLHFHQVVPVTRPSGARPFTLQISALGANCAFGQGLGEAPRAIGFLSDPEQRVGVDPRILMQLYTLTPMEARVAVEWVDCDSPAEVADFLAISANTLKTHVRHIYQKMGVESRAAFVRLILGHASMSVS